MAAASEQKFEIDLSLHFRWQAKPGRRDREQCQSTVKQRGLFVVLLRLQQAAENASNQIITDNVTCTTSATRKKSTKGNSSCTRCVRARTRSIEKILAATREIRPRVNHADAAKIKGQKLRTSMRDNLER